MSMLEKMARAIVAADRESCMDSDEARGSFIARAALQAIREPDAALLQVGSDAGGFDGYRQEQNTPEIWRAMIDAILNPGTET